MSHTDSLSFNLTDLVFIKSKQYSTHHRHNTIRPS